MKNKWIKPQIIELNTYDTKSGDYDASSEASFWFITWRS